MTIAALPVLSDENSLSSYIRKVNAFPYLTEDEELDLARQWTEEGNVEAAHALVTSHLRFVVKIALGFKNYGLPVQELISEGNVGLMQAVKKFDHTKGFRLSTYSMWWIKASVQDYVLRSWSLVKIGTTAAQKKLFFNLRRMKNNLKKIDNSALSPQEVSQIANDMDVPEREVVDMDSRLTLSDQSLNMPLGNSDGDYGEMIDVLPCQAESHELVLADSQELDYKRRLLSVAMKTLNEREQDIISQRRLSEKPATLEDLSKIYDISKERVRQIEKRAMEKLQLAVTEVA